MLSHDKLPSRPPASLTSAYRIQHSVPVTLHNSYPDQDPTSFRTPMMAWPQRHPERSAQRGVEGFPAGHANSLAGVPRLAPLAEPKRTVLLSSLVQLGFLRFRARDDVCAPRFVRSVRGFRAISAPCGIRYRTQRTKRESIASNAVAKHSCFCPACSYSMKSLVQFQVRTLGRAMLIKG